MISDRTETDEDEICSSETRAVDDLLIEVRKVIKGLPKAGDLHCCAVLLRAAAWVLDQKAEKDMEPIWRGLGEAMKK